MNEVLILGGARTAIGSFQGGLASLTAPQLGSIAIRGAIERSGIDEASIDEAIMGCVLTGGMGQAPARQAVLGAGLSNHVPCLTINKVCGSGMKSAMLAAQAIRLGDSEVVIAGGMESMSNAPYVLDKARTGYRMGHGQILDTMIHDGLWDPYGNVHMGNCGDATAVKFSYSREAIDAYAAQSYERAKAAQADGRLAEEIVPVMVPQRKGDPLAMENDEEPGKGDPAKLGGLRPAFGKEGVTTAGNASSINDGACALVLGKSGPNALGKLVAASTYAHAPEWFTTAPTEAVKRLLAKTGLTVADIDLFEINEAFSVVAMVTADQVGIPSDKLNVNGGAVSLGHPIGMTGARLILTALYELKRRGGRYAICSPCIGGGEATAVLIENV